MATLLRPCHRTCIRRHISLVLSGAHLDRNGAHMARIRCQPVHHRRRSPLAAITMVAWQRSKIQLCHRPRRTHTIENAWLKVHSKGHRQGTEARLAISHARTPISLTVVRCRLGGACRHRQRLTISRQCHTSQVHHQMARHRSSNSHPFRHPSSNRHHTRVIMDSNLIPRDLPTRLSSRTDLRRRMAYSLVRHNNRYRHMVVSPNRQLMHGRRPTTQRTLQADNIRATRTITTRTPPRTTRLRRRPLNSPPSLLLEIEMSDRRALHRKDIVSGMTNPLSMGKSLQPKMPAQDWMRSRSNVTRRRRNWQRHQFGVRQSFEEPKSAPPLLITLQRLLTTLRRCRAWHPLPSLHACRRRRRRNIVHHLRSRSLSPCRLRSRRRHHLSRNRRHSRNRSHRSRHHNNNRRNSLSRPRKTSRLRSLDKTRSTSLLRERWTWMKITMTVETKRSEEVRSRRMRTRAQKLRMHPLRLPWRVRRKFSTSSTIFGRVIASALSASIASLEPSIVLVCIWNEERITSLFPLYS
jgi:hypothetical protein